MTNVDLGAGNKESMEVASPDDQDTNRLIKNPEDNKNNCSDEQINVTKSMEEVENQKKERTVNLIRITPIEKFYTQQAIKLQNVGLHNNVNENILEIINKIDNNGEIKVITDQQNVSEAFSCVKRDITIDQNFQGKDISLNETTNIEVKKTDNVSKYTPGCY
jgi:hypothetical protein